MRGTMVVNNPTITTGKKTKNLYPKTKLGTFTILVAGLPLKIDCYLKVDAIVTASAMITGTFSYSASFYQTASMGATYNYVRDRNNPLKLISYFPQPQISLPAPDFSGIKSASLDLKLDIQPTPTLSL